MIVVEVEASSAPPEIISVLAALPRAAALPRDSVPAERAPACPAPPKVFPPVRVSWPRPVLIRLVPPLRIPPKVRILFRTVMVRVPVVARAKGDVPKLRLLLPVNVKSALMEELDV